MRDKQRVQQVVQKMKLLVILTLAGFYTCQAEALGQNNRITLHVSDAVLSEVLRQIEDLTGYMFVYKSGDIERAGRVTLKAENMEVSEILNKCFAGSVTECQRGFCHGDVVRVERRVCPVGTGQRTVRNGCLQLLFARHRAVE